TALRPKGAIRAALPLQWLSQHYHRLSVWPLGRTRDQDIAEVGSSQCAASSATRDRRDEVSPSASAPLRLPAVAPIVSWSCVHPSLAHQWCAEGAHSGEEKLLLATQCGSRT